MTELQLNDTQYIMVHVRHLEQRPCNDITRFSKKRRMRFLRTFRTHSTAQKVSYTLLEL